MPTEPVLSENQLTQRVHQLLVAAELARVGK